MTLKELLEEKEEAQEKKEANKCGFVKENERCNDITNLQHQWNDRYFCQKHYNEVFYARENLKTNLKKQIRMEILQELEIEFYNKESIINSKYYNLITEYIKNRKLALDDSNTPLLNPIREFELALLETFVNENRY